MPREQITYERIPAQLITVDDGLSPKPESTPIPPSPVVQICWHGEPNGHGWVQVRLDVDRLWLAQALDDDRKSPIDVDVPMELYSEVLTREECNKLVRVMRRARDQAYGKDE